MRSLEIHFSSKSGLLVLCFVMVGLSTAKADVAVLQNGYGIQYDRLEQRKDITRFYLSAAPGSYVDVPTDQIVSLEHEEAQLLPAPSSAPVVSPAPLPGLDEMVSAASSKNYVDRDLINSVISAESGFNPRAVSPKGAQGLMQLMPQTAANLGVKNAMDPAANIAGGTRYLRELLERYNNDLAKALAAYNAGPQRVEQYHGVPPYPETHAYVARVIRDFNRKKLSERRQKPSAKGSGITRDNSAQTTAGKRTVPGTPSTGPAE
jgi:soluble lytic murein transglycosylase-like protein